MPRASDDEHARSTQLLAALQQLLAIDADTALGPALDQAIGLVGGALDADIVDIFLYEASTDTLVAVGSPSSALGRQQRATGLDRLALADGGMAVNVFRTGERFLTGNLDREPGERRDVLDTLEIRSTMICPIWSNGTARGVVRADSAQRDWFSEADLRFLEAVSGWVGLFARRIELAEQLATASLAESRGRASDERGRLTPRERDVAVLVAAGLTNDEIAERLTLVRGTVANHIVHILRKLNFSRRVQIATWSVQHGLWTPDAERIIPPTPNPPPSKPSDET